MFSRRGLLVCAYSVLGLLAGCQEVPSLGLPPLESVAPFRPDTARTTGRVFTDRPNRAAYEDRGAVARGPAGPAQPRPSVSGDGADVTLNFADTDIREVARVILGTTLKLNYTIDPAVHGTATLDTGTSLPRTALLPTLETLLNQNGATLIRKGGLYAVVPVAVAGVTNSVAGGDAAGAGTQVIPLRYASARDLAKILQPYVADGSKLAADPGRNALIINGDPGGRQALVGLVRSFDVDTLAGQSFALFPASEGDVAHTAAALEKALQAGSEAPLADMVRVVPLPRANAVLVASSQPRYIAAARRFFSLQARAESASARSWHIYYVQNGQSADLANLLQRAFTPGSVTTSAPPGSTPPGADTATLSGGTGLANNTGSLPGSGRNAGLSGLTTTPASAQGGLQAGATGAAGSATAPSPPPATEALSAGAAGGNEDRIRVIANQRNNALLIYATPSEYAMVEGMLARSM